MSRLYNFMLKIFSLESKTLRDTWITTDGKLMASRYEAGFEHGDFCIDQVKGGGRVVAVMCDACKKGVSHKDNDIF